MARPADRSAFADVDGRVFLAVVPLVAHLLFSWIGFNPTDDGFVLAYGRRLLDGQVPHRDFIALRPVGSPLLHLPELLAGDFVLYASRLVWWCELALVAWVWVPLLAAAFGVAPTASERFALRLVALLLSAHVAPPRAWHTVDGITLASIGIALAGDARPRPKTLGYVLVGAAALCKQNFGLLAPIVLGVLGDWRRPRYGLAVVAPGAAYALVVTALGGGAHLAAQLGAQHDLVTGALVPYASSATAAGLTIGALAGWAARRDPAVPRVLGWLAVLLAPAALLATAATGTYGSYARGAAFVLFGAALARATALVAGRNVAASRAALLALALAWASAISIGYRSPAYASGVLAVLLLLLDWPARPDARQRAALAVLTVLTLAGAGAARTQVVYRDRPAAALDRPLGTVFGGGAGIRTNARTHEFLADLNRAIAVADARGRPYAIVPDVPGHWATARQANPLPIDWPQAIELPAPALAARVTAAVAARRGTVVLLVQKVRADTLATAAVPLADDGLYPIVTWIRATLTKTGETEHFDLYE